jgi:aryl-alcohol dehydrogenase
MNSLAVRPGSSLAVFGAGSVGLAAVMAACIVRARIIIAVDIKPKRLKLALELGATHVIDNRDADVARSVAAITGRGVDYTVETSGDGELFRLATELLNPRGRAAFLTGASGPDNLPGGRKALSVIQGNAVPQQFIPKLIRLWRAGRFPFDRLVKFYAFKDINRAIADSRKGDTIKPVLRINRS